MLLFILFRIKIDYILALTLHYQFFALIVLLLLDHLFQDAQPSEYFDQVCLIIESLHSYSVPSLQLIFELAWGRACSATATSERLSQEQYDAVAHSHLANEQVLAPIFVPLPELMLHHELSQLMLHALGLSEKLIVRRLSPVQLLYGFQYEAELDVGRQNERQE